MNFFEKKVPRPLPETKKQDFFENGIKSTNDHLKNIKVKGSKVFKKHAETKKAKSPTSRQEGFFF